MSNAVRTEQLTVGTDVATLAAGAILQGVTVKAHKTNTVAIFVGNSDVETTTGYELNASESVFIPARDMSEVSAISGSAAQKMHAIGA